MEELSIRRLEIRTDNNKTQCTAIGCEIEDLDTQKKNEHMIEINYLNRVKEERLLLF